MSIFKFHETVPVRYGDLDPQGHVNNTRFLAYTEQARLAYLTHLGLWDGASFLDLGIIVADIHISFKAPIYWGQTVRVSVRVSHLGNKSLNFEFSVEDEKTGQVFAQVETIVVAYDYHTQTSIPIPPLWREKIAGFEGIPPAVEKAVNRKD
jgi:acyl-CoA thioester hydrolase